ncbi:MAG: ABC transporter permease [Sedimentibacter sp.]|uniref:ABC transporter permease n=1 Tax=Sedimentibacter sp. TaxID=1960295 RepID=UPI003158DE03
MKITRTFKLAIRSILSSKARSFLTMLGIIIGVAAVIIIVGLGNGMENYMVDNFKSMGTNILTVNVSGRSSNRSISVDDMYAAADGNPELFTSMSPTVNVMGTVKVGSEELEDTSVSGVSEDYREMKMFTMATGRFIKYADVLNRTRMCVIGSYISDEWFSGNALGQTIKINNDYFIITGVLDEIADSTEGSSDDCIFIPYTTAAKLTGTGTISSYSFAMVTEDKVKESKDALNAVLYKKFGSTDAYSLMSMSEMLDMMTSMIDIVVTVLTVIAGISLLVGGIGIMNIMLVSVSERTREIGIRKALGAQYGNILLQFVIEAGTTSAIGGVIGIAIGYMLSSLGSVVISRMMSADLVITPSMWSVLLAFGVSVGIGILFGYLPARKAARLNPIDALRYE